MKMRQKLQQLYNLLFFLFCFSIPFENQARIVPNIFILSLVILFPFVLNKRAFVSLNKKLFISLVVFVGYCTIVSLLYYSYEEFKLLKKLIVIPLVVLASYPLKKVNVIAYGIITGTASLIALSLANIGINYFDDHRLFVEDGFDINSLLLTERLYSGMFCTISYLMSMHFLLKFKFSKWRHLFLINILVCGVFVLLISSRLAILLIVLFTLIFIMNQMNTKKNILIIVFGSIIIFAIFKANPNTDQRFFYVSDTTQTSYFQKFKDWEPRYVIWECSSKIFQLSENQIFGVGIVKTQEKLLNCYEATIKKGNKKEYFLKEKFNSHNQFLDILLTYGIMGLALFVIFLVMVFKEINKQRVNQFLYVAILLFCCIENVFHRQIGVYIFAVLVAYLLKTNQLMQTSK